ncbi:MAG TPA: hypothetical protein PK735_07100, partial [Flavobacteriales bacterium]|nr:hypothetical protein [Flavobacteriales bacterium]
MNFTFSKRARTLSMAAIVLGVVTMLIGFFYAKGDHHAAESLGQRGWSSLLVNSFFFLGISLGALFFYALGYATETAWTVMVKRVYEGIYGYLPIGAITLCVVLVAASLHLNHVYHWMDDTLYSEYMVGEGHDATYTDDGTVVGAVANPNYDVIIAGKRPYLNLPFFWIRTLVYLGTFLIFARWFRKQSLEMDQLSGETLVKRHLLNYRRSAVFLVCFAVFSSMLSWDWIMSIDTHWFSTLFGWYTFSGMWVSSMITAVIIVLYLKRKGYLPQVNNSHIQDMGKWVFACSFLWSYLYFSQFMLIWYSNIPEEVTYFQ